MKSFLLWEVCKTAAKLKKKGKLARNQEGKPVIVNEKDQAFKVPDAVIAIWQRCDGKITPEDLAKEISEKSNQDKDQIQQVISKITSELERVELVELSE